MNVVRAWVYVVERATCALMRLLECVCRGASVSVCCHAWVNARRLACMSVRSRTCVSVSVYLFDLFRRCAGRDANFLVRIKRPTDSRQRQKGAKKRHSAPIHPSKLLSGHRPHCITFICAIKYLRSKYIGWDRPQFHNQIRFTHIMPWRYERLLIMGTYLDSK